MRWQHEHGGLPPNPGYAVIAIWVSHCGSGCVLGTIIGELAAFEIGQFSWMVLMSFVFFPVSHPLRPDSPAFWFLMQIGMIAGFFATWPLNAWLIRAGIKAAI